MIAMPKLLLEELLSQHELEPKAGEALRHAFVCGVVAGRAECVKKLGELFRIEVTLKGGGVEV